MKKCSGNTREEDKLDYRTVKVVRKIWSEKTTTNNNKRGNKWKRKNKICDILNMHKSECSIVVSSTSELILLP